MVPIKRNLTKVNFSSRYGQAIKYLVVHFTGNYTDSDEGNAVYFNNEYRGASANYFIDDDSITQVVDDINAAWHCGDGYGKYGITNQNSLGFELCGSNGKISETTEKNAAELIRAKMLQYNIDIDHVVRHYDASRKVCPSPWAHDNWAQWYNFKQIITGCTVIKISTPTVKPDVFYQVHINGGKYLPFVKNDTDYAGTNLPIDTVRCYSTVGSILYKVHTTSGKWYPYVSNLTDYAGVYGQKIDGVMMKSNVPGKSIMYRVFTQGRWLPWVKNDTDYAGIYGNAITGLQVKLV